MAQYIDKDALVAEIKSRIGDIEVSQKAGLTKKRDADKKILFFKSVLSLIKTLEVKEVDLENFVKGRIDYPLIGYDFPNIYPNYKELKFYCDKNGIKDEDKVKIIIIKEE